MILETAVSNAILVGVLALLLVPLARLLNRPALLHALWVLLLVKLVTPALVTIPLPPLFPAADDSVVLAPTPPIESVLDRPAEPARSDTVDPLPRPEWDANDANAEVTPDPQPANDVTVVATSPPQLPLTLPTISADNTSPTPPVPDWTTRLVVTGVVSFLCVSARELRRDNSYLLI